MSETSFFLVMAAYLAIGLTIAGGSVFVWRTKHAGLLAYPLFPWNAIERCVGEQASYSICGACCAAGWPYVAAYVVAVTLFWPIRFPLAGIASLSLRAIIGWSNG